jgi:hypothetical protein
MGPSRNVNELRYSQIERQLVDALPEIRPAADFYWQVEGEPGQDCGPYIFFEEVFACYVEVLLWLPAMSRRDELLRRAFGVSEQMFESVDRHVQELIAIGLFEGRDPAWLKRARPFAGARASAWLNAHHENWRDCMKASDDFLPRILDGYGVRTVVSRELRLPEDQVPGETYALGTKRGQAG